jgi:hypothetical protein
MRVTPSRCVLIFGLYIAYLGVAFYSCIYIADKAIALGIPFPLFP